MLQVELRHRFAGGPALDMRFSAPLPGVVALFGPSGAGKSTLVHTIAGLFRPDHGQVRIGTELLCDARHWLPPERRRVGLVFQQALLFPHLDVAGNLRYGARRARVRAADEAPSFDELVALLGLERLLARRPRTLSGGERQRVAIGRAILSRPLLLAMDEPLAGLDDERRGEILSYLARLRVRLRLPILYVTHAIDEVLRLADTIVLVRAGQVVGCGPASDLLGDVDASLAVREDAACVLQGRVVASEPDSGLCRIETGGFTLRLPAIAMGARVRLKIPAQEVMLGACGPLPLLSVQNVLAVQVLAMRTHAEGGLVTVSLRPREGGGAVLLSRVTADAARRLALSPGMPLLALIKSVSIMVMDIVEGADGC